MYTHHVYMCIHVCAGDGEKQESDGAQGNASRYSESRTLGRSGSLFCLLV
jgi:hypothetical protein